MKIPRYNGKPKIIIFSGAGLSSESDISTFRDSNGLWENHKIDEVCNQKTWKNNFELVHKFYNERRIQLNKVNPNEAHKTISRIKAKYKEDVILITQNVDDLLERSGIDEEEIIHVHGKLTKMECLNCKEEWDIGYSEYDPIKNRCPKCDSRKSVKPKIVFFGGNAPLYHHMKRAFEALENKDTILIVVGTMGNVVHISSIIGELYYDKFNHPKFSKKVKASTYLNNLDVSIDLNEELFNEVFYEKATTGLLKIEKIIEKKWNK